MNVNAEKIPVFLNRLIHDLKNPLTPLMLGNDLLLDQPDEPELQRLNRSFSDSIREMNRILSRASRAILLSEGGLKSLAELCPGPCDLNRIAEASVASIRERLWAISGDIHFEMELQPGAHLGHGAAREIQEALTELLDNAVKFGNNGEPILVHTFNDGLTTGFIVRDQGTVIPEAERMRIFDLFEKVDSRARANGWGFGLSWAREIARLHGGDVEIQSDELSGTSAIFRVPTRLTD